MERRKLGRTGLKVSVIGFGGIPFDRMAPELCQTILGRGIEAGINVIETAQGYGGSQEHIGTALAELGMRDHVILASKSAAKSHKKLVMAINDSLRLLGVEAIDLYQIHGVSLSVKDMKNRINAGVLRALDEAKEAGKIRFTGVTGHDLETVRFAMESYAFDTVQVAYNLGASAPEETIFPLAAERGAAVLAMKPLAGGFLVPPKVDGPRTPGAKAMTAALALQYVLSNPLVSCALVGMSSAEELDENVAAAQGLRTLAESEREAMAKHAVEIVGTDFCRCCNYCAPCAKHGFNLVPSEILRLAGWALSYGLDEWAKQRYAERRTKADACEACGTCESKCPYGVPIVERLAEAHRVLTRGHP